MGEEELGSAAPGIFGFGSCPMLGWGKRTEESVFVIMFLVCTFVFTVLIEDCGKEPRSKTINFVYLHCVWVLSTPNDLWIFC